MNYYLLVCGASGSFGISLTYKLIAVKSTCGVTQGLWTGIVRVEHRHQPTSAFTPTIRKYKIEKPEDNARAHTSAISSHTEAICRHIDQSQIFDCSVLPKISYCMHSVRFLNHSISSFSTSLSFSKICLVSQSIQAHCFISFFSLVSMLFLLLFYSRVITVSIDKSRYAIRDWLACILFAHRFTRTNYKQRPHIEQYRIRTIHFWRRAHVRRGERSVASHTRRRQMVFRVLRVCIARSFVNCP